jgi:two-component system, LytTR family, sensor kinase
LGALAYAHYSLVSGNWGKAVLPELLGWLTCYYPWLAVTPLVFILERRFPVSRSRLTRHIAILAVAGLVLAYIAFQLAVIFNMAIEYGFREPISVSVPWWKAPGNLPFNMPFTDSQLAPRA